MEDLYYRRVWQWSGTWKLLAEGYVRSFTPLACQLEGPTHCSLAPPYLYEKWWKYKAGTWGTGGDWSYAGEQGNWLT